MVTSADGVAAAATTDKNLTMGEFTAAKAGGLFDTEDTKVQSIYMNQLWLFSSPDLPRQILDNFH